ncbi:MAG TPA: tRNA (N6-isopentenyl adenosine(37)-C2)-methylthiotransferase MiaB [Chlamydiales bacterium]|nr:tRNA (N6-isopentenyl adenosine(37)-C2)-methylthiotransferase MiaB [Chlamydiales bacterium]
MPKTFFIRTYGCQMNELDTEIMAGQLKLKGLTQVNDEKGADLMIFNTCSIRDLAERKVMGKVGQLTRRTKNRPIIGITGCMAMAKKETLFRKLPHIDFVLGTNNITDLGTVLDEVVDLGQKSLRTTDQFEENLDYLVASRESKLKAHVSIIRGCDKFCTYCVVPYTRGQEVSRPAQDIVNEIQMLVDKGYKEVTLLGQNVNSYGKGTACHFHDLLHQIDKTGIARVRFMTSHPVDITEDLMHAIAELPSLCEFVHFPIQAGSSRILKKMHRIYTKEQYYEKVALLRKIVPNASIGTDIIVGFPTETEEEFQETLEVFRDIRYSVAFLYTYSQRKGTPAMRWKDDIPDAVKQDRLHRLMELHDQISSEERQKLLGQTLDVLVEKQNQDGLLSGRTRCWRKVIFKGPDSLVGTLQNVQLHSLSHQTLIGDLAPL